MSTSQPTHNDLAAQFAAHRAATEAQFVAVHEMFKRFEEWAVRERAEAREDRKEMRRALAAVDERLNVGKGQVAVIVFLIAAIPAAIAAFVMRSLGMPS